MLHRHCRWAELSNTPVFKSTLKAYIYEALVWVSDLMYQSLSFLILKLGLIIFIIRQDCHEEGLRNHAFITALGTG